MLESDKREVTLPSSPGGVRIIRSPRFSYRWCLELLWNLTLHRINLRYKETLLGFGWIFLQPVGLTLIFNYIRRVANIPTDNVPYPLFVAVGLVAWSYTSLAVNQAIIAIAGNSVVLKRVAVPRILFPLSTVTSTIADLMVMTFLLVGLFIYYGHAITNFIIWIPVLGLIHLSLLVGLSLLVSLAQVFLKDIGQATPHLLWLWFFASPVFYPASMVPREFKTLARWNPMAGLIESYRSVLLLDQAPPMDFLLPACVVSAILLGCGILLFCKLEGTLSDML